MTNYNLISAWKTTVCSFTWMGPIQSARHSSSQSNTCFPAQLFCNMNIVEGYLAISATKQKKKNNRHWKYNCACPGLCFIFISSWKKEKRQKKRTLAALNQSCFQSEWNKLQKLDYCNMNHSVRAFILFSSLSPCFWVKLTLAYVWDRLEWVLTLRAAWVLARVLPCKIRRTVSDRSCRTESQLSVDLLCHKKARVCSNL